MRGFFTLTEDLRTGHVLGKPGTVLSAEPPGGGGDELQSSVQETGQGSGQGVLANLRGVLRHPGGRPEGRQRGSAWPFSGRRLFPEGEPLCLRFSTLESKDKKFLL